MSAREQAEFHRQAEKAMQAMAKAQDARRRQQELQQQRQAQQAQQKQQQAQQQQQGQQQRAAKRPRPGAAASSKGTKTARVEEGLSSAIYKVHEFLRQRYMDVTDPALTPMQTDLLFEQAIGPNLREAFTERLREALAGRPKIAHDPERDTMVFQPKYDVRNYEQLLATLEQIYRAGEGGMRTDDLKECYLTVMDDVQRLKEENKVRVVSQEKTKGKLEVLHFREAGLDPNPEIDDEVRRMWNSTPVGHPSDVRKFLDKNNLSRLKVLQQVVEQKKKKKKKQVVAPTSLGKSNKLLLTEEDALAAGVQL